MAKVLRGGYTTGACAAAGVKAALLYLKGEWDADHTLPIEVRALDGTRLSIPIQSLQLTEKGVIAEVIKDAGDDPDITNGVSVFTEVVLREDGEGIRYFAGEGIGYVTKPGLSVAVGEPSINPGPRELIANMVKEVLGEKADVDVTISIPAGVELSKKTLNPTLGIVGGISVIGTTGVLRPMSEEGFKNSLVLQIDMAKAAGYKSLIFVPGKIGERVAVSFGLPEEALVQTSNFIGFMLEAAADRDIESVLLLGHIGKLAKVAAGSFYTHNRMADGRLEAIAAYAAAEGLPAAEVKKILAAATTEEALPVIEAQHLTYVYDILSERASERAKRYLFGTMRVGTLMTTLQGTVLGADREAKEIGKALGWNLKF
ncbi:cobalt-precorrin-5B (C(1))-methyltransferase CbiD [Selenomonas sp. TAMA-11512]|uniref:cobalt-precorrin-5B (C(1))-methyltransferase CbiD n=1 Tax=Selenomonas sp. TAMA-11512 TaxID=3095337 RepID=UPI00309175CA|nr:cobalt-precorrin-5B (C(1))-methyltransferase CbiD [Selenomonas sp. TAMA-11512]